MKEELISFETAKLAKEKGFDEYCQYSYSDEFGLDNEEDVSNTILSRREDESYCTAPTQSLLQKWLREKYSIGIFFMTTTDGGWLYNIVKLESGTGYCGALYDKNDPRFNTYEEALELGLREALKYIKV